MKSIVLLSLLATLTCCMITSAAYPSHHPRVKALPREPLADNIDLLKVSNKRDLIVSNAGAVNPLDYAVDEGGEEKKRRGRRRTRSSWDEDEDQYFQWAKQNRRPLEYLAGRKRDFGPIVAPTRIRRINGGLWRSGLVG